MSASNIAYQKSATSFQKFLSWTNEKVVLGEELQKYIKPGYKSLLDVGAGNGDLDQQIVGSFSDITLVEPSKSLFQTLKQKYPQVNLVNSKIENYNLSMQFDMILASHVFTYIEEPNSVINRLYSALNNDGVFVIIMLERSGDFLKYTDKFRQEVLNAPPTNKYRWENIVSYLKVSKLEFSTHKIVTTIKAPSLDDFMSINDFNFNGDVSNINASTQNKMRAYLSQYVKNGSFEIPVFHQLIAITK